ncbi:MAG: sulfotransferase [Deltaproteobacteria bacterium]|nr:sulfotransferase [Deltaproteobacteria bacterium]
MASPRLAFLLSPPRSGSTLLQRMLGSHAGIYSPPEPHLLAPLAHLGYFANVERAPYDHLVAAAGQKDFVKGLPRGEDDYVDALRAYVETLYGRALGASGRSVFLDKTPENALVAPFIERVLPDAKFIVLVRHPVAVMSSHAESFFEGDWARAYAHKPILSLWVPAIARFLRTTKTAPHYVRYEDLVARPEEEIRKIFDHLGVEHQDDAVEYGKHQHKDGAGDPFTVRRESRPVAAYAEKWLAEVKAHPAKLETARRAVDALQPEDLETYGYPYQDVFAGLENGHSSKNGNGTTIKSFGPLHPYRLQRRMLLALRKDIHTSNLGKVVKKVRFACDVLLRD